MKNISILKAGVAPVALGLALVSAPAFGQVTDGAPVDEEAVSADGSDATTGGGIVVTGSRIARPDLEAPSPVTVVGEEQIALTGTQTLESLLNDLPQVVPGATTTSNNPSGTFGTIDLRGLGPGRTLILLNGERLPPSTSTGITDISIIPTALVQRVEVVSGGASAVYGSDAIGGVVNFILKNDFEGVEMQGQVGINENGTGLEYAIGGIVGGNFADGRGNLTVAANYFNREGISTGRFRNTRVDPATYYDPATDKYYPVDDPSDIIPGSVFALPGGSSGTPWGSVTNNAANPFRNLATLLPGTFAAANTDCNAATPGVPVNTGTLSFNDGGQLTPFFTAGSATSFCGIPLRGIGSSRYNFAPDNLVQLPYDRYNFTANGTYEFSDSTRVRVFGAYTESRLTQQLAPTPAIAPGTGFTIDPTTAVGIPADLRIALNSRANPNAPFQFSRRFTETGPRLGNIESRNILARFILEHDISDRWSANLVGSWGRNALDTQSIGNVNRTAVEQGLVGCRNNSGVVNGAGILPGCVPVNIYGPNTITPAALAFIQTDTFDVDRFEQSRVAANLTGQLFELPGGWAGIALGAEIRKDTASVTPDDAKQRGEIIGFNAAGPQAGQIDVKEVYGEVRLPILGGSGFPDLLAVEAGARYSDYSTIGGLFNWKVGAEFAPVDWIRFRGSFNKAARAPNVQELFQGGDQGFPQVTDPCARGPAPTDPRSAATLALCSTVGGGIPAADLATFAQQNQQIQSFAFGQPDLQEERAETWTAGVVVSPKWWPLGRFNLTADYYHIEIAGSIQALSAQFYLAQCFTALNTAECARVNRDPSTGQIISVDTGRRNNPDTDGPFEASGIDIGADWSFPLSDLIGSSEARVRFSNIFSYVMDYGVGGADEIGTTGGGGFSGIVSKYSNTATLGVDLPKFGGQLRWVYKSGADDFAYFGTAKGINTIKDLSYFDLSLRWRPSERFEFTGIVSNLFDERPQQINGYQAEQSGTSASFFAPIFYGRSYTVSARVRF